MLSEDDDLACQNGAEHATQSVQKIKEEVCFVAPDFEAELRLFDDRNQCYWNHYTRYNLAL